MHLKSTHRVLLATVLALAPFSVILAQGATEKPTAPATTSFDTALKDNNNWYASWGYSRQQYAPSDIHISQPSLGNDFTVHQAKGSDYPTTYQETWNSLKTLDFTLPQQNIRVGRFMNPEKTFALEFSIDHTKYNTDLGQTARISGVINNQPVNGPLLLDSNNFFYALHNGLNHVMINGVWFHHLRGPVQQPGQLQLISRLGAGILLPHADNTILGNPNEVGPKNEKICCFNRDDWWQLNGWTAGVEVGLRYRVYKSIYLELTQKFAYGELRRVPVYKGSADQSIWMSEQVLSTGFLF